MSGKEPTTNKLLQDLTEAQSSNAVLITRLAAVNELSDGVKQKLEDNTKTVASTWASFGETKMHLNDFKDIVQSGMPKLDDKVIQI